jgi:hypothetical protein
MPVDFKHIQKYCKKCGSILKLNNTRDVKRKNYCSRSCGISVMHTESAYIKIGATHKGIKNLKKGHPGSTHPNYGKKLSKQTCDKKSDTMSRLIIEGKFNNQKGYKNGKIETRFGAMHYRSQYELDFIIMCELDQSVKYLQSEPFRIKMDNNRYYVPDFLINNRELVEIKPSRLIDHNMYKIQQGIKYCELNNFNYKVITEKQIYNA